ncbi:MAG: hypothetical protein Q7S65_05015 [Nanoarchaeota archaeon]|nr:hypothetical protein [Nanoarchaeota archaeon]
MEKTTAELTVEYIKEHPHIKHCLQKGILNYSSLSRLIAKDLGIEKSSSKEAILVASRRFQEKLRSESFSETKVRQVLERSELEIRNKIAVLILKKPVDVVKLTGFEKDIRQEGGLLFSLDGSDHLTLISQERNLERIAKAFPALKHHRGLALVTLKSPAEIESTPGVVSFLTALFAENGVNIIEFLSCWRDTLFVIEAKHVAKAHGFLNPS